MLLGVQSRKTGLNVKENIKKDEYSMENIDDFFKDDDTSLINSKGNNRRSSLLSSLTKNNVLSHTEHQSPILKGLQSSNFDSSRRSTEQFHGQNSSIIQNHLSIVEEDLLPVDNSQYEEIVKDAHLTPKDSKIRRDTTIDRGSIRLTPEKPLNDYLYNDVPDLVDDDDEDTRDFTSLNTSENALLEDELDDDFVLESEEDRDYVEGESILNEEENSNDDDDDERDDESSNDSNDTDNGDEISSQSLSHPKYTYGDAKLSTEIYDSDEESIREQAREVIDTETEGRANGLRRSRRVKVAPLEYWRNEKVVYKRKSGKPVLDIDKIITYDQNDDDEEEELGRGKKKRKKSVRTRPYNYIPTGKPRGRPRKNKLPDGDAFDPNTELLDDINSGKVETAEWLKHGILEASVNNANDKVSKEIVAFAPNLAQSEQIKETDEERFSLEVMFDKYKENFASGMLKLPVRGNKKVSDSHRTFITFYIIEGVLEVTLAGNVFLITKGSSIQIPAFNQYSFRNKGNNEAKMFFVQVTLSEAESKVFMNEKEMEKQDHSLSPRGIDKASEESESEGSLSSMSISEI